MTDSLRDNFPPTLFELRDFTAFVEAVKPLGLTRWRRKKLGAEWRQQTGQPLSAEQWRELVPEEGPRPWPPWVWLSFPGGQEPEPPAPAPPGLRQQQIL